MSLLFNSVYYLFRYSISAKVTKIIEKLSFYRNISILSIFFCTFALSIKRKKSLILNEVRKWLIKI